MTIGAHRALVGRGPRRRRRSRVAVHAGGRQVAGRLKRSLSRAAGAVLHSWRGSDPRPDQRFQGVSAGFVREVGIESGDGFEIALELVAKARRRRLPIAEIPSIWADRTEGESNFRAAASGCPPTYVGTGTRSGGGPAGGANPRPRRTRERSW